MKNNVCTFQSDSTLWRRQITNRFYNSPFIVFIVLSMHIVFLNSGRATPFIQAMAKENIFFRKVFLCTFVWTSCYRRTPAKLVVFPPRPTCPLAGAGRAEGAWCRVTHNTLTLTPAPYGSQRHIFMVSKSFRQSAMKCYSVAKWLQLNWAVKFD